MVAEHEIPETAAVKPVAVHDTRRAMGAGVTFGGAVMMEQRHDHEEADSETTEEESSDSESGSETTSSESEDGSPSSSTSTEGQEQPDWGGRTEEESSEEKAKKAPSCEVRMRPVDAAKIATNQLRTEEVGRQAVR